MVVVLTIVQENLYKKKNKITELGNSIEEKDLAKFVNSLRK